MPQLPESNAAGEPMQHIELLQGEWTELSIRTENLEAQLRESQEEAKQQHWKIQEKMEIFMLEGNNARATLHKRTVECTRIFRKLVNGWVLFHSATILWRTCA
jgi:threonyl-tRNA synthetase